MSKVVFGSTVLLVAACGHEVADPTSTPIAPIAYDALFVINGGDSSISVIDAATDAVAGVIALGNVEHPHHVYLSGDRSTMLVAVPGADLSGGHGGGGHSGAGAVLVLDASTGALRGARRLEAPNHNAAFAPDGAIWTAQTASPGTVLVLDAVTLETKATIPVESEPAEVTFSASAARAFVANTGSDSVSVFDAATRAPARTLAVGDGPVGAWPARNGRMYVDNEPGRSLTVIDATTLAIERTVDLGFTPAVAALGPDDLLWVTDVDGGQIVFLDPADGARRGQLATGAGAHAIAFDATGAKAYVTNQTAGTVSVVDVATRAVTKTITVGSRPNGIVFRPRV